MKEILIEDGKRKVKLRGDYRGMELLTMRNGQHWTGQSVDDEIVVGDEP